MPKKIEKALKLIDEKCFVEAENYLLNLKKSPTVYYLLGYIHHINLSSFSEEENAFAGSKEKAKKHFISAIDSEKPIEDAFYRLAKIEDSKRHAVRILKKSLEFFPNSESIYELLLSKSENKDVPKIYEEIEKKGIRSNDLYFKIYSFYWKQKEYIKALSLINKIKGKNEAEVSLCELARAYCLLELSQIDEAKIIFEKLINNDINQKLNYAQYIGLLACLIRENNFKKISELINELPYKFEELFAHVDFNMGFDYEKYFQDGVNESIKLLKTKKECKNAYARIRGIRAIQSSYVGDYNNNIIPDLNFARRHLSDNEVFETELVNAHLYRSDLINAFKQELQNTVKISNYKTQLYYDNGNVSTKELEEMLKILLEELDIASSWKLTSFKEVVENMLGILFAHDRFGDIVKLRKYFSDGDFDDSSFLFEIAFSCDKAGERDAAKVFYQKEWKKKPSSAVANNLALLLEQEDDPEEALKYLEEALKLEPNDDVINKNLNRVRKRINDELDDIRRWKNEQDEALRNIKAENIYIHQRLLYLINAEDEQGYIIAPYSRLPQLIKASPEKTQEIIKNFLQKNYLHKVQNHNIDTQCNVYKIFSSVREFILELKKRIEDNVPFECIAERINIDSFEKFGFDNELLKIIDSKISNVNLREILKRDLKENVFALLTESFKTALVLSGSIIESFILNKVLEAGITKYLPSPSALKNKKIISMDLGELLYVADQEKILDVQLYHFSQALRSYRNYIHPAVEIRKGIINKITDRDAKIAWEVTKKVLFEI